MPGVASAAAPLRRVDSSDANKTHVVKQDLAIASSTVTPVKLQRPVPTAERREQDASPSPDRYESDGKTTSRKRTNTSSQWVSSPTTHKRRSAESLGFSALLEGELDVVEQIESSDAPTMRRSLGKTACRLTRQGRKYAVEVDTSGASPRKLPLATVRLVHDAQVPRHSFMLAGLARDSSSLLQSFSFTAASDAERQLWVKELKDILHVKKPCSSSSSSSSVGTSSASTSTTASGGDAEISAHARRQEREEMAGLAMNRPERPVKRGRLVYSLRPKMTHIILVRHGHYVNAHAKNLSDADQVLSQMGKQQAELTGKYLETLYHRCPARNQQVALFHSDLSRAVETATLISKNFTSASAAPVASSLLREGWPGQPFAMDQMPAHMLQSSTSDNDSELDRRDLERMEKAYDTFFAENLDEDECLFRVIVCHANLIRYLLCRALRIEPKGVWGHFEINHCGVTRIDMCRNRPLKVQAINETGHLPDSLKTSSEDHL